MEFEKNEVIETHPTHTSQTSLKIDFKRIIELILYPLNSLKLSEKDFRYGIIGLVSSYVAFLLWSLLVTKKINALFNPFYDLAFLFTDGSRGTVFLKMFSKLMLTGLWSTISLLVVVWLVSWWLSDSKPEIKSYLTRIGGIQYIGCVGYLLACIVSASLTFSIMIIVITLLLMLVLTLYAAVELYGVAREKISLYFLVTISGYILLFGFMTQLLF